MEMLVFFGTLLVYVNQASSHFPPPPQSLLPVEEQYFGPNYQQNANSRVQFPPSRFPPSGDVPGSPFHRVDYKGEDIGCFYSIRQRRCIDLQGACGGQCAVAGSGSFVDCQCLPPGALVSPGLDPPPQFLPQETYAMPSAGGSQFPGNIPAPPPPPAAFSNGPRPAFLGPISPIAEPYPSQPYIGPFPYVRTPNPNLGQPNGIAYSSPGAFYSPQFMAMNRVNEGQPGPRFLGPSPGYFNPLGGGPMGNSGGPFGSYVGAPMGIPIGGPLGNFIGGPMRGAVRGPMGNPVGGPVSNLMGGPFGNFMAGPMGNYMGGPMRGAVGGHMGRSIGSPIVIPIRSPMGDTRGGPIGNSMGGPMGAFIGGPTGNMYGTQFNPMLNRYLQRNFTPSPIYNSRRMDFATEKD